MNYRVNISSNTPWEAQVGYSRAVKAGNQIFIAGTTATNENGDVTNLNDPYSQTRQILLNIENALQRAGAELVHVVRTRIFVSDINHWQEISRAHHEFFQSIKPAATLVQVSRFIAPEILVEIEADAVLPD